MNRLFLRQDGQPERSGARKLGLECLPFRMWDLVRRRKLEVDIVWSEVDVRAGTQADVCDRKRGQSRSVGGLELMQEEVLKSRRKQNQKRSVGDRHTKE